MLKIISNSVNLLDFIAYCVFVVVIGFFVILLGNVVSIVVFTLLAVFYFFFNFLFIKTIYQFNDKFYFKSFLGKKVHCITKKDVLAVNKVAFLLYNIQLMNGEEFYFYKHSVDSLKEFFGLPQDEFPLNK